MIVAGLPVAVRGGRWCRWLDGWRGLRAVATQHGIGTSAGGDDVIAAMTQEDASLTGLITGGLLVLLLTYTLFGAARSLLGLATNAVSSVVGAATSTAANTDAQAPAGLQNFVDGITRDDVEELIASQSPSLNETQIFVDLNSVSPATKSRVATEFSAEFSRRHLPCPFQLGAVADEGGLIGLIFGGLELTD